MARKRTFASFLIAAVLLFAASAWATANVNIFVTGAPTSALQGETKNFTVNISGSGKINITGGENHPNPALVTVNTVYTAGDGSDTPDSTSAFSAPATPAGGCEVYTTGANNGQCKPTQEVSGGPYAVGASVVIPPGLTPGIYTITIVGSADNQDVALTNPMPSFDIEVLPAGSAPSVTINSPANGGTFKVNEPVTAGVEIDSDLSLLSIEASLNGEPVSLEYNGETLNYEAALQLSTPGSNTFFVEACNSIGCGNTTSTFTVRYDWGGWLPPITTAKFQSGRTLPVKFTVNDYYGPTPDAVATVWLDQAEQGQAGVLYDPYGLPYYQLDIKLNVPSGSSPTVRITLDDGVSNQSKAIAVK
jgi:hypothetical protein